MRLKIGGLIIGSGSQPKDPNEPFGSRRPIPPTRNRPPPRPKGRKVRPEELRELRELIRQRYALDLEIWGYRKVANNNRKFVQVKMERADAILDWIKLIISNMDRQDNFSNEEEYKKFEEIKRRIMESGKRSWVLHPPWEEAN